MTLATTKDRKLVTDILTRAFADNKSVNYIISASGNRERRIRALVEYSFDICNLFGKVYLSEDRKACALIYFSDEKKNSLKTFLLDLKLICNCTGLINISKVMERERAIKSNYPDLPMSYLWFIGVEPQFQKKGTGKILLEEVIEESRKTSRPVYLETSSENHVSWYLKSGFELYNKLDLGYNLFMLRKEFK